MSLPRPLALVLSAVSLAALLGPAVGTAASAAPAPAPTVRTVPDPVGDAPDRKDLTGVTYRHGPRWVGASATVVDLTRDPSALGSGYVYLDSRDGHDSVELAVSPRRSGGVHLYATYQFHEDASLPVRCDLRGSWRAGRDTFSVWIDRACLDRFLRREDAGTQLPRLRMQTFLEAGPGGFDSTRRVPVRYR